MLKPETVQLASCALPWLLPDIFKPAATRNPVLTSWLFVVCKAVAANRGLDSEEAQSVQVLLPDTAARAVVLLREVCAQLGWIADGAQFSTRVEQLAFEYGAPTDFLAHFRSSEGDLRAVALRVASCARTASYLGDRERKLIQLVMRASYGRWKKAATPIRGLYSGGIEEVLHEAAHLVQLGEHPVAGEDIDATVVDGLLCLPGGMHGPMAWEQECIALAVGIHLMGGLVLDQDDYLETQCEQLGRGDIQASVEDLLERRDHVVAVAHQTLALLQDWAADSMCEAEQRECG